MGGWEIEGKQKHEGKMKNKPAWPHPAWFFSINSLNFQVALVWLVRGLVRMQLRGTVRSLLKEDLLLNIPAVRKFYVRFRWSDQKN